MYQGQGFPEAPRIGWSRDVAYDPSIDGEFCAMLDDIVVIRDYAEEFYFLFAFKFKHGLLAAKVALVA